MSHAWGYALLGGAMIGAASALLLVTHGRIAGISGITGSLLRSDTRDRGWRYAFIGGLVATGVLGAMLVPAAIGVVTQPTVVVAIAGLLVGIGTSVGSGCTSGHGVCGLSRLSPRSLVAVPTFMLAGALTVWAAGAFR